MRLSQILPELSPQKVLFPDAKKSDPEIQSIRFDTRNILKGDVFVALKGTKVDGHTLFLEARKKGASVVVGEEISYLQEAVTQGAVALQVENSRQALALLSCIKEGFPARKMQMIGVTGTNGKTTTTYLVEGLLRGLGKNPGVIGTVEYRLGKTRWPAAFTTPEAPELQKMLQTMLEKGATHTIMEVSSHGLELARVGGILYQAVAFTNLSQDHLDFHESMDTYFQAKSRLFTGEYLAPGAKAVLNIDDPKGALLQKLAPNHLTFSLDKDLTADLKPLDTPDFSLAGFSANIQTPEGNVFLQSSLVGPHNLANLLTAFGLCLSLGFSAKEIASLVPDLQGAPGRLERIEGSALGFDAFVDYAHTPDALENVLQAFRPLTPGRMISVFGCGGDRDRSKRPKMGNVVAKHSDLAVVTSDNPRTEDPMSIIDMIIPGVENGGMLFQKPKKGYWVDADRTQAIRLATSLAKPGDVILIFGKGHEDYQILGTQKIHFDDREQARQAFEELRHGGGNPKG